MIQKKINKDKFDKSKIIDYIFSSASILKIELITQIMLQKYVKKF